jgi:protein transport protein SEC20
MDKVVEAVEKVKKEWDEAYSRTQEHIKAIEEYGKSKEERNSLPRLNGLAQDGLALLSSLQFNLDLLAPQLPSDHEVQSATALLHSWKSQSHRYNSSLSFSLAM